ncbi:autotransporter [Leminorella grimontii]|uniref:Autotransporter n=2 Tax=Leminorella grimontii TaxID=82981 RepID=A0AAV5N095_9GAMM|nr:autotransporter [Leminorella grimontii]
MGIVEAATPTSINVTSDADLKDFPSLAVQPGGEVVKNGQSFILANSVDGQPEDSGDVIDSEGIVKNVTITANDAYILTAYGGGTITLGSLGEPNSMKITGDTVAGINVNSDVNNASGNTYTRSAVHLINSDFKLEIEASGIGTNTGINVEKSGHFIIDNTMEIVSSGNRGLSHYISVKEGSSAKFGALNMSVTAGKGVIVQDSGTTVEIGNGSLNSLITIDSGADLGIFVSGGTLKANRLTLDMNTSKSSTGVDIGALQILSGTADFTNSTINLSSSDSKAVLLTANGVSNGGALNFSSSVIDGSGSGKVGVLLTEGTWSAAFDNSTVTAEKAFSVVEGSVKNAELTLDVKNNSTINGAIDGGTLSNANILKANLTNSTLNGQANGNVALSLTDSTWNDVGAGSSISSLALNNGTVKFASQSNPTNPAAYSPLTVQRLTGNGSFYMSLLADAGVSKNGDLLRVTDSASGTHTLYITMVDDGVVQTDSGEYEVVDIQGNQAAGLVKFLLPKTSQGTTGFVSADAFEYYLHEGQESGSDLNNWYLRAELPVEPEPSPSPTPASDKPYREAVPNYIVAPYMNMYYNYRTVGKLHERQGDTLKDPMQHGAAWARMEGESTSFNAGRFGYDTNYWFAQFGKDLYQKQLDNGTLVYGGVMVTLGSQNTDSQDDVRRLTGRDVDAGSVRSDAYSVGGYYTRFAQDGSYADFVGQFTYYHNVYESDVRAKQNAYGALVSAEVGKPFELGRSWYVEPQGQLAYQYYWSEDFDDDISSVDGVNKNWLLGRAGTRVYHESGRAFKPYLTADVLHNFTDAPKVTVGTTDVRADDLAQDWWQVGAGFTYSATNNTSFYGEGKYIKGFSNDIEGSVFQVGVKGRF